MSSRPAAVIILVLMAGACGFIGTSGDAGDAEDDAASSRRTDSLDIVDRFHYCRLESDGAITCKGNNSEGQADPPTIERIREGAEVEAVFSAVADGWEHSCGLVSSRFGEPGFATCWGSEASWPRKGQEGVLRQPYAALTAGGHHTCGLLFENGEAECWGSNTHGQTDVPEGTEESPEGQFEALAAGGFHTCGLREGGEADCWGSDEYGQRPAPEGRFEALAAGGFHTCGLREGGEADCWGSNEHGQSDAPDGPFKALAAGVFHSCGLRRDDGGVICWGSNEHGQTAVPPGLSFDSVSASGRRSCGRVTGTEGKTECWGAAGLNVAGIAAGSWHHCQLGAYNKSNEDSDEDSGVNGGEVACLGDNTYGQADAPGGSYTDISANVLNSCAVRTDGDIVCWGDSSDDEGTAGVKEKIEIKLLSDSANRRYAVAVGVGRSCGTPFINAPSTEVKCWIPNSEQPEDSAQPEEIVEVLSRSPLPFLAVATGREHTCALVADAAGSSTGSVFCWISSRQQQAGTALGYETAFIDRSSFTAISSGWSHSCGLRAGSRTLECWGGPPREDALWDEHASPALWEAVPGGTFTAITSGGMHACALSSDNRTVTCWGDNYDGQLDVPTGTSFKAIAAGAFHSCGLVRADETTGDVTDEDKAADGTIRCWGRNTYGQTDAPAGKFRAIAASGRQTCALPEDSREIACWGQDLRS